MGYSQTLLDSQANHKTADARVPIVAGQVSACWIARTMLPVDGGHGMCPFFFAKQPVSCSRYALLISVSSKKGNYYFPRLMMIAHSADEFPCSFFFSIVSGSESNRLMIKPERQLHAKALWPVREYAFDTLSNRQRWRIFARCRTGNWQEKSSRNFEREREIRNKLARRSSVRELLAETF